MKSYEEVQKALEKQRVKEWVRPKLTAVGKLPRTLRPVGYILLNRNEAGEVPKRRYGDKYTQERERRLQQLAGLSEKQRRRLVAATLPGLDDAVQAGWQLQSRLPVRQSFWSTGPFRSRKLDVGRQQAEWLEQLIDTLAPYPADPQWLAAWAGHLNHDQATGRLLAAVLDLGGDTADAVFETFTDIAAGEHDTGTMGSYLPYALLVTEDQRCWEYAEKLLLAAQRQEGLRQTILENVAFAHPQAFRRFLRLILEHRLVRFPSVVRAADVWFGTLWDSASMGVVKKQLELAADLLDDEGKRQTALATGSGEEAYFALWAIAFEEVTDVPPAALPLLKDKDAERRYAAVVTLDRIGLPMAHAGAEIAEALVPLLADKDVRVADRALDAIDPNRYTRNDSRTVGHGGEQSVGPPPEKLFGAIAERLPHLPKKAEKQKAILFPWCEHEVQRSHWAGALSGALGDRPATDLLPYLDEMDADDRGRVAHLFVNKPASDGPGRDVLFTLAADASSYVRDRALVGLRQSKIKDGEAEKLEPLLRRKSVELRRGVFDLLLKQKDKDVLASADRLLGSKNAAEKAGGLELCRQLIDKDRMAADARERVEAFRDNNKRFTADQQRQLDTILKTPAEKAAKPKLADGFGLLDVTKLTPPPVPQRQDVTHVSAAALECIKSLAELVASHKDTPVTLETYGGKEEMLLGNVGWQFPDVNHGKSRDENLARLPIAEVWQQWYDDRPKKLRDADGRELERVQVLVHLNGLTGEGVDPQTRVVRELVGKLRLTDKTYKKNAGVVDAVIGWLRYLNDPQPDRQTDGQRYLDACEDLLARVHDVLPASLKKLRQVSLEAHNERLRKKAAGKKREGEDQEDADGSPEPEDILESWPEDRRLHLKLQEKLDQWREPNGLLGAVRRDRTDDDNDESPRVQSRVPAEMQVRRWKLLRYADVPGYDTTRQRPDLQSTVLAVKAGVANEHDLIDLLIGPREKSGDFYYYVTGFSELGEATAAKTPKFLADSPEVLAVVDKVVDRLLEVELARGVEPTEATDAVLSLRNSGGLDVLLRVLEALGRKKLTRNHGWGEAGKTQAAVFSHLLQVSRPAEQDTPEAFAEAVKKAKIPQSRLLDLAFYAPQWADHVEAAVGWAGLAEGVWWMHAHTKDDRWDVEQEVRDAWKSQIARRTPLESEDLTRGAVDVAWFGRIYEQLKKKRWEELFASAKYASGGGGHKRAELFATTMLGQQKKTELLRRVKDKRHKDAVAALGLLPLARGKGRDKDLLSRYSVMQEFLRSSKQFGAQRQESEKLAVEIGMQNLARTAGYADPLRLQWAMELEEVRDLSEGPVVASAGDVSVTLAVDDTGAPGITVVRATKSGPKELKNVPAKTARDKQVKALRERRTALRRQTGRMRKALEAMMVRGEPFTAAEVRTLSGHALLWPMLQRVVLVGDGVLGYPVHDGQALEDHAGKVEPVKPDEQLRIAHAADLLDTGVWDKWQHDLFARERVQPFKQVFRELYTLTGSEKREESRSRRYAGQQVNPSQAFALLGGRGWIADYNEGGVTRTFHDHKLQVEVQFQDGYWTPGQVDGLTLEAVVFRKLGEWMPLPLTDVPPRLFSEVMRDLDLVVSVAHRGGVDPEASASTVEMRASLLGETLTLFNLDNVTVKEPHVLIDGELGDYTVHLGSAVVHRRPGGMIHLVAVHAQHRGRLFLPFADDDPKTAEVLSKVLMLAEDRKIQDPILAAQLRG